MKLDVGGSVINGATPCSSKGFTTRECIFFWLKTFYWKWQNGFVLNSFHLILVGQVFSLAFQPRSSLKFMALTSLAHLSIYRKPFKGVYQDCKLLVQGAGVHLEAVAGAEGQERQAGWRSGACQVVQCCQLKKKTPKTP